MNKKLITLALAVILAAIAFVQLPGGTIGSRDMSGDGHARATQPKGE